MKEQNRRGRKAKGRIKMAKKRRITYEDVERYFRYTKKYVTQEFYLDMKQLHDIDDIRNSIFTFFEYCEKKDDDLFFLKNMSDYDYLIKQFQKMVLDMNFVFDTETKKKISIKKLLEQEKEGMQIAKQTEKQETKEQKVEGFKRRKYTNKELLFLKNKLAKGIERRKIAEQYDNFLLRNNLSLRSRNAIYSKMRRIENER
jgi:hypothetical protein